MGEWGSGIKSIQRGSVSLGKNANTTITITAIDTGKAFLTVSCVPGYHTSSDRDIVIAGKINSSTELYFKSSWDVNTLIQNPTAYYEVVEYA